MAWEILAALGIAVALWAVLSTYRVLHPQPRAISDPSIRSRLTRCSLVGPDGAAVDLWAVEATAPRGVVIGCHGYYANHRQLLGVADGLAQRGYATLLCDLRGHGSRRGTSAFGRGDLLDIGAILSWRRRQPALASLPLGLLGFSFGAALACEAMGRFPAFKGVVLDSAYARFFPILARAIRTRYRLPAPFAFVTWVTMQLAVRRVLGRVDPAALAARCDRPLLLIHGGEDQTVPPWHARRLYDAWRGPKELWMEPRAMHVGTYGLDPAGYCNRLADFLDRWLLR